MQRWSLDIACEAGHQMHLLFLLLTKIAIILKSYILLPASPFPLSMIFQIYKPYIFVKCFYNYIFWNKEFLSVASYMNTKKDKKSGCAHVRIQITYTKYDTVGPSLAKQKNM